ncbi:UNVERIFIED_CONTAM: hypothetical protein PYX00_003489 [Menopon gallinae]|uniref:Uncharacterized protein n=1 Tax=Menopon gallinae TaxID=328185 RepID=A0AAW2I0L9_9NEOP
MHFFNSVIVILIDDNMYLKSMRYAFYKLAKDFNISFCQVYLKSPLEQCLERNFSRASNSIVPVTVISDMNAKLEPPRVDNKWEKHTLVFQTDDDYNKLYSDYFELLDKALENPESIQDENDLVEKEKSVFICMTNVLHQSDIALRQIVSNKIQNSHLKSKPDEKKEFQLYCTKLNNTKGKILNDIKLGIINIPEVVLTEIKENMLEKTSLKLFIEQIFDSHLSGN